MPSLTRAVRVPPRVLTVTETTWPGLCALTCRDRAAVVGVACPSTAVITSPLVIPARAAGLPGSTAAMMTPRVPLGVVATGPGPKRIAERAEWAGRVRGLRAVDDLDAEERPAAEDQAGQVLVRGDLAGDDPDRVGGDGEAEAGAAGPGGGGGVHADHRAGRVHERAAGVARGDRRVGLQQPV